MSAIAPDKGNQNGSCNVTACQKPNSAEFYNNVMHKWYCYDCACEIEYFARKDNMSFYPALKGHTDGALRYQMILIGRAR